MEEHPRLGVQNNSKFSHLFAILKDRGEGIQAVVRNRWDNSFDGYRHRKNFGIARANGRPR